MVFPVMSGTVVVDDAYAAQPITLPLLVKDAGIHRYAVDLSMHVRSVHPNTFFVVADDCIQEVWVNDQRVNEKTFVFCDPKGRVLDLGPYINAGENSIQFILEDRGGWGALAIVPAASDRLMRLLRLAFFTLVFGYGILMCRICVMTRKQSLALLLLCTCAGLWSSFQFERVHMQNGNIDYSYLYTVREFHLANAAVPWKASTTPVVADAYEPPLHRWATNATVYLSTALGRPLQLTIEDLYRFNLVVLLCGMVATLWVGTLLFPRRDEWVQWLLFAAFVGAVPGFGYFASATNGAAGLSYLFSVLCLGLLLRWITKKQLSDFLLSIITIILAVLTQKMGILLIVLLIAALFFCKKNTLPAGIRKSIVGFALLGAMLIWFLYLRNGMSFVLNLQAMVRSRTPSAVELLPDIASAFWSSVSLSLQENMQADDLFTSLYREAMFGGFYLPDTFNSVIYVMLLLGRIFVLLAVAGAAFLLWHGRRIDWFLLLFAGILLGGDFITARWFTGDVPKFAHISPVLVPVAYILVRAVYTLPRKGRWIGQTALSAFFATCVGIYYLFL